MKKKTLASILIPLSLLTVLTGCDDKPENVLYEEFESYVEDYLPSSKGSDHVLFERPTKYTAEYLSYDCAVDPEEDPTMTISLLPYDGHECIVNDGEWYFSLFSTDLTDTDPCVVETEQYVLYSSRDSLTQYQDRVQTTREYSSDLASSDEYVSKETYEKYGFANGETFEAFNGEYVYSAYGRSRNYTVNGIEYFIARIFGYDGKYVCTEEVSKEGDVISFYFTRQYYAYEFFVYEGTLDMSNGTLDYTEKITCLYSYGSEYSDPVIYSSCEIRYVFSFSDENFETGFSREGKEYEEVVYGDF